MDLSAPNARASLHEAGHTAACLLAGVEFEKVFLQAGLVEGSLKFIGPVRADKLLFILAAGLATEKIFYGLAYIGCQHDLVQMLDIFQRIGYADDEAGCLKCFTEAEKLLTPKRDLIQAIARALQERQQLTYHEVKELL